VSKNVSQEELAVELDFKRRCDEYNAMLRRQVHCVGPIAWQPVKEGHRFVECKPHTWPRWGLPDGVSKNAMFYVFEKI
jgi:hypothetical protein